MDDDASGRDPIGRSRSARALVGLLVASIAGWVVIGSAGGVGEAIDAIRRMRPGYVALALALTVLRMGLYSAQLGCLGRRSGPMSARTATGLALVVYGFGAVTPAAPAEGLAVASGELRARGRTKREAWLTLGFSKWFAQRTFYVVAALDVFLVVAAGHLTFADGWPFLAAAAVVLVLLALTAVFVRGEQFSVVAAGLARHVRLHRLEPPGDPRRTARQWQTDAMAFIGPPSRRIRLAGVSAAAALCDVATLWATTHATGFHIHPELVVLACTVGTVASWVPLLPSGLGIVEVAVPAVLHRFGVPLDAALAATVVYRGIGTLLPAIVGTVAIGALRTRRPHAQAGSVALPIESADPSTSGRPVLETTHQRHQEIT